MIQVIDDTETQYTRESSFPNIWIPVNLNKYMCVTNSDLMQAGSNLDKQSFHWLIGINTLKTMTLVDFIQGCM